MVSYTVDHAVPDLSARGVCGLADDAELGVGAGEQARRRSKERSCCTTVLK